MKKSSEASPVKAPEYGESLVGLTVNLLSTDLARALIFQRDVLGVEILHHDPDIIIVRGYGCNWMVHADHTYDKHPMLSYTEMVKRRGAGIELRLHCCNPDATAMKAIELGFRVLDGPRDQPDHGLREVHILDQDSYIWVPDISL